MYDATACELRRSRRALTGPTGALLAIRLATTAAHLATGLGVMRALPGGGKLRNDDLVDERDVDLYVEDLGRQLDRPGQVLALGAHDVDARHDAAFTRPAFTAVRTRTRPPVGPGTAPRMSSTPFSASTAWMVSDNTVVRTWPIRPAIRVPLNTRAGVAHAPMEPGARCLRWVPCPAPSPLKLWRFIPPAVPLPLLVPTTSTFDPASKTSAVIS